MPRNASICSIVSPASCFLIYFIDVVKILMNKPRTSRLVGIYTKSHVLALRVTPATPSHAGVHVGVQMQCMHVGLYGSTPSTQPLHFEEEDLCNVIKRRRRVSFFLPAACALLCVWGGDRDVAGICMQPTHKQPVLQPMCTRTNTWLDQLY